MKEVCEFYSYKNSYLHFSLLEGSSEVMKLKKMKGKK